MKNTIILIMSLNLALFITGCSNQNQVKSHGTSSQPLSITSSVMKVKGKGVENGHYWIDVSNSGAAITRIFINKKSTWNKFIIGKIYSASYSLKNGKYVLDKLME